MLYSGTHSDADGSFTYRERNESILPDNLLSLSLSRMDRELECVGGVVQWSIVHAVISVCVCVYVVSDMLCNASTPRKRERERERELLHYRCCPLPTGLCV